MILHIATLKTPDNTPNTILVPSLSHLFNAETYRILQARVSQRAFAEDVTLATVELNEFEEVELEELIANKLQEFINK